jgi:hypothetical protein
MAIRSCVNAINPAPDDTGGEAAGPACDNGVLWEGAASPICAVSAGAIYKGCYDTCSEQGLSYNDDAMAWFSLAGNHTDPDPIRAALCPGVPVYLGGADCSQALYCAGWGCAYCGGGASVTCSSQPDDVKTCPCE